MYSGGGSFEDPAIRKARNQRRNRAKDNLLHLFTELGGDETTANKFKRTTQSLDKDPVRTVVFSIAFVVIVVLAVAVILNWLV